MAEPTRTDELITLAQNGDQRALAELFELYRDRLSRMVNLRMNAAVQARVAVSDVLQEAYVDVARQIAKYSEDPKLPFFLWLRMTTGQRLAKIHRDHLGREMRDVARERRLDSDEMPDASSVYMASQLAGQFTSVSEKAIRHENESRMRMAIETLSATDREILALRHVEQLSNKEIALVLGISESAATNRYVRTLQRLRDMLDE